MRALHDGDLSIVAAHRHEQVPGQADRSISAGSVVIPPGLDDLGGESEAYTDHTPASQSGDGRTAV